MRAQVLEQVIAQIRAYENLNQPVVDAFKYLCPLSTDVLSYVLLLQYADGVTKVKQDGTNVAAWFGSLAQFAGFYYRRYSSVELEGLLQYVFNQLVDKSSVDLLLLRELLSRMGGVEVFDTMSDAQVLASAGGETLRLYAAPTPSMRLLKRAGSKLRSVLINRKLAIPLLVLVAQQRVATLYATPRVAHLKLLGDLFDKAHETLLQLSKFITHVDGAMYARLVPSLHQLVHLYHLEPVTAFHLVRPALPYLYADSIAALPAGATRISAAAAAAVSTDAGAAPTDDVVDDNDNDGDDDDKRSKLEQAPSASEKQTSAAQTDGALSLDESLPPPPPADVAASSDGIAPVPAVVVVAPTSVQQPPPPPPPPLPPPPQQAVALTTSAPPSKADDASLFAAVRALRDDWSGVSVELYTAFWSLSLYDIEVPREQYDAQQRAVMMRARACVRMLCLTRPVQVAAELKTLDANKQKDEVTRLQTAAASMRSELAVQERHVAHVLERLHALASSSAWTQGDVAQFLQLCVVPRSLFSLLDATYCARFLLVLQRLNAAPFAMLQIYDKVMKNMTSVMLCASEGEATQLGRFLRETFAALGEWRKDRALYERMCPPTEKRQASYDDFVRALFSWHVNVARIFLQGLDSKDYMQIRNTVVVLTALSSVYPAIARVIVPLEKRIDKLRADEREDIKVIANRYHAILAACRAKALSETVRAICLSVLSASISHSVRVRTRRSMAR
jgi:THO complex subunit 2